MYKIIVFSLFSIVSSVQAMDLDNLAHVSEIERFASQIPQTDQEIMDEYICNEKKVIRKNKRSFEDQLKKRRPKRTHINRFHYGYTEKNEYLEDEFFSSAQPFEVPYPEIHEMESERNFEKYALAPVSKREKKPFKNYQERTLSSIKKASVPTYHVGDIKY